MNQLPAAPPSSSPAVRAVMQGNRSTGSKPEAELRSALHRRGLRFRKNARPGRGLPRADILFPRAKLAVFVDGCFWHRCPIHGVSPKTNSPYWRAKLDRNVSRDRRNTRDLAEAGWTVVRIWEHEDPRDAADEIAQIYALGKASSD
jgi:DNA mismatch endonuclease (patch repair protein)